jgi:hypothetical protein
VYRGMLEDFPEDNGGLRPAKITSRTIAPKPHCTVLDGPTEQSSESPWPETCFSAYWKPTHYTFTPSVALRTRHITMEPPIPRQHELWRRFLLLNRSAEIHGIDAKP